MLAYFRMLKKRVFTQLIRQPTTKLSNRLQAFMRNSLEPYHAKRRFDSTPEPHELEHSETKDGQNRRLKRSPAGKPLKKILRFVVQKHAASHLHYDFRLELNGTLKSWAVPKGPSLDPTDKRMAVQVEDHPLDYANFEGTIPAGNYGAGTVIVWDTGEWIPRGNPDVDYAEGKLKFELRGSKLSGHWTLVRTRMRGGKRENWLLIKERDDEARSIADFDVVAELPDSVLASKKSEKISPIPVQRSPRRKKSNAGASTALPAQAQRAKLPLTLAPQLATLTDAVPTRGDWLYEVKFDGYRILARFDADGDVHLFTRNGNDWSAKMPTLLRSLRALDLRACWLDGEIIATDESGVPSFQRLQNMFEMGKVQQLQYFVFDVPFLNGYDLSNVPLIDRRELLQAILPAAAAPNVQFSANFDAPATQLMEAACAMQFEGVIGKRAYSGYRGGRGQDWIKLKCKQRQEFVIGGYTDSKAAGSRELGALLLGVHDDDGKLRYAGKVGTGFTHQSLAALAQKLRPMLSDKSPFVVGCPRKTASTHWVKPKLLAEVEFSEWTSGGSIRHASFQGLRSDKSPRVITQEKPFMASTSERSDSPTAKRPKSRPVRSAALKKESAAERKAQSKQLKISHPDRVIDDSSGATKADIANFYISIARWLLPQLHERPVSLIRAPTGVSGQQFFQKHKDSLRIPDLHELDPALLPGHPPLIAVNSAEALLGCAQMNVIEFHTWNAQMRHIEQPDRMLFDLDPGEGIGWDSMVDAAMLMKALLDKLKLRSFVKTSGGKGLHIVVPLTPGKDWDTVKDFSEAIARHMAATIPQLFVAKSGPRNRVNRIFIDYLRNGRGATTVAAFSLRARPGLGISMPIAWEALHDIDSAMHWHIGNVDREVAAHQMQSWRNYASTRQSLTQAMRTLGFRTEH